MVVVKSLVVWVVIVVAEVIHGFTRAVWLAPLVGDFRARQIAVFTGSALVFAIALAAVRWIGADRPYQLIGVGVLWVVLMLGFEIGFGRAIMGYSWERVGSDYDLLRGGLLPIGLLVLAAAPAVAAKIRGRR